MSSSFQDELQVTEPDRGTSRLDALLDRLVRDRASDLHLKPMRPPLMRINGRLTPLEDAPLEPAEITEMLDPIVPARLRDRLESEMSIDFGYGLAGISRFRTSIFCQRGTKAAVFRRVPFDFPSLEDWGLPPVLADLCDLPQGLVLITGPTGSGKSSTLAAMLQRVSKTKHHHIVTIEDPIEFLIADDLASVSQREIGIDTPDFSLALRGVLRQDPDVIMVGEMRDEETIRTVITAAETGHLVFSTLHTNSAIQTVDRIVTTFPDRNHHQIRQQLAASLEAVVSMQLVPRADDSGMIAAVEILRRSPQVAKLLLQGDLDALQEAIESSVIFNKMQTMNQSLAALIIHGEITRETGLSVSANPSDLDLLLRKIVGATTGEEGENTMAEPTSDFSKILELQEIKKLYDELQGRFADDIRSRDQQIGQLQQRVEELSDNRQEQARIAQLESENAKLADQIRASREEYEAKVERLNNRLRELSARANREPAAEPKGRGFFRR